MVQLIRLKTVDDILTAKYSIEIWLLENLFFEFYQAQECLLVLSKEEISFTLEFGKLIFAYWTENQSESWKVTTYKIKDNLLHFTVCVPFKKQELVFLLKPTNVNELTKISIHEFDRQSYLSHLCILISQHFCNLKIEKASINNSLRVNYKIGIARLLFKQNDKFIASVTVSKWEKKETLDFLLSEGLKWLELLRKRLEPLLVNKLIIFAPTKIVTLIAERLTLITQQQGKIELFEIDEVTGKIAFVNPFDQGDLGLFLSDKKLSFIRKNKLKADYSTAFEEIKKIKSISPKIEILPNTAGNKLFLQIKGLSFAQVSLDKSQKLKIQQENLIKKDSTLKGLVNEIAYYRQGNSINKQHLYYRSNSESWLQSVLSRDLRSLDPELVKTCFYCQVRITKETNRVIDILAVTNDGQLVIIELKTVEDADLPFQVLDYWLRIEWYRSRGDLQRRGYFPNIKLKNVPAKVYLVVPRLRCHKDLLFLANFIDERLPLYRIAINDNWRQELKVEWRERINGIL